MIHTAFRSLLMAREFRARSFMNAGNYTARQFGNFTAKQFGNYTANFNGPRRFGYMNPYGGFVNDLAVIAAVIAIVGIIWLGIALSREYRL